MTSNPKGPDAEAARHERVRALLNEYPNLRRVLITDHDADPDAIIVTVGVRGYEPSEVKNPRESYDGGRLRALLDRFSADQEILEAQS